MAFSSHFVSRFKSLQGAPRLVSGFVVPFNAFGFVLSALACLLCEAVWSGGKGYAFKVIQA